jgi:chaperonin GroES
MSLNLRPCGDRVVIERKEVPRSGILLPDVHLEREPDHREGTVLAVGTGKLYRKAARRIPLHDIRKGQRVVFSKWAGSPMKIAGRDVIVMQAADVLAVVE